MTTLNDTIRGMIGLGGGRIPFYLDSTQQIPFTPGSAAALPYEARLAAVSTPFRYMTTTNNTYVGAVNQFNALSAPEKLMAMLFDPELPWLSMMTRPLSLGVLASWITNAAVMTEFTRKATALGHPTTLTAPSGASTLATYTLGDFKWLAWNLRQDIRTYASDNGCPHCCFYGSFGMPFSDYTGQPIAGSRPSALLNRSHWQSDPTFLRTIRKYFDDQIAEQVHWAMLKGAGDAHCMSTYSLVPNSDIALQTMPYWSSTDTVRKLNGAVVNPDYVGDDTRYWVRDMNRRFHAEFGRAGMAAFNAGMISGADLGKPIESIMFMLSNHSVRASYMDWNHWHGLAMKDPVRVAEDEVAALFDRYSDANTPFVRPIRALWGWGYNDVYHGTELVNVTNTGNPTTDGNRKRQRHSMEKLLFNRAIVGVGEPFGVTNLATQDAYFNDPINAMPDSMWSVPGAVWRTAGVDNTVAYGCSLTSPAPSPLFAHGLPASGQLLQTDIRLALRHFVADLSCLTAEAIRAKLDQVVRWL